MDSLTTTITTDGKGQGPVRTYLERVKGLLSEPKRFFRETIHDLSLSDALAFGILSAWLASILAFALQTMNSLLLTRLFETWVQRIIALDEGFSFLGLSGDSFLWTAGFLVLAPFFYLLRIFLGSLMLYLFARLLVEDEDLAPEPVTFKGVMRIQACAFGGQWFSVVPVFGTLLAFVANLVLLVTGVRERFSVSTRRAMAVVLAPYFFLLLALFLLFLLALFAFFQLPFGELLETGPFDLEF